MTPNRLDGYGPVETTTAPRVHVFHDEAPPARRPVQHRARTTAAETIPQPKAATGTVFADHSTRTLYVRLSELENGYASSLWQDAWSAMRTAYERGWPADGVGWVYCSGPGVGYREVHGTPEPGGQVSFHWPVGTAGYGELIAKPGLACIITMDISSRLILGVKFFHRPA